MDKTSLIDKRFGRLIVKNFHDVVDKYISRWECVCDCGNTVVVRRTGLHNGTKSCGCARKGAQSKTMVFSPDEQSSYEIWYNMKRRCYDEKFDKYSYYGGDGVTVCERWLEPNGVGFRNFLEDMGKRPENMSLNRIRGAKVYSKENCEWTTMQMQSFDQRRSKNNKSGRTGVSWDKRRNNWVAYIDCFRRIHLGNFYILEDAIKAREEAEIKYYGWTKD